MATQLQYVRQATRAGSRLQNLNRVLRTGYKIELRNRKYLLFQPFQLPGNQVSFSVRVLHSQTGSLTTAWAVAFSEGWVDLSKVRPGTVIGRRYKLS